MCVIGNTKSIWNGNDVETTIDRCWWCTGKVDGRKSTVVQYETLIDTT